jgi:hypothetical protein
VYCFHPCIQLFILDLFTVGNPIAVNTHQCCGVGWVLRVELSLVLDLMLMVIPSSDELVTLPLVVPKRVPTYICSNIVYMTETYFDME